MAWMISARVRTASVLARPGTPSSRMWPPVSSPTSSRSTIASWPTIRRDTSLRIALHGQRLGRLVGQLRRAHALAPLDRCGTSRPRSPARRTTSLVDAGRFHSSGVIRTALYSAASSSGVSGRYRPTGSRPAAPGRRRAAPAVHLEPHRLAQRRTIRLRPSVERHVEDAPALRARPHPDLGRARPAGRRSPPRLRTASAISRGGPAVHQRGVAPGNPVARMGEPVDRLAVGREQQQAGGHDVEPADVGEPGRRRG